MIQALARVDEIRSGFASLQEPAVARSTASAGATAAGAATGAADFASVLASVTGTTGAGSADLTTGLLSALPGAQAGTDDLASRLWSALAPGSGAAPATATAPATTGGGTVGAAVVETAREYLGVPYVWGGESLAEGGLDCSGLVQLVLGRHGVDVPRVAADQMRVGTEVASLAEARAGDLVVQRGGKHIGIYVGDGRMIHAPRPGETVEITPVTDASVTTIRRVVG
ncbi:C40 family peptidase [Cellulosimicrobium sp. NPDC057127]|uniref:C40 family peptidase n=1 Tax=Cellulosimicrobium sp. NPDC057127 TaxID=3346026 RepID=UPI00363C5C2D